MFVARDEDGTLKLCLRKPMRKRCEDYECNEIHFWGYSKQYVWDEKNIMILPTKLFPTITWEDEPVEVKLTRVYND